MVIEQDEKKSIDTLKEHSTPRISLRYSSVTDRDAILGKGCFLFHHKSGYVLIHLSKEGIPDLIKDLQNAMDK